MTLTERAKEMQKTLKLTPAAKAFYSDYEWNMHAESDPITWPSALPIHPEGGILHVCFHEESGTWFNVSESKTTGELSFLERGLPTAEEGAEIGRRLIDHSILIEVADTDGIPQIPEIAQTNPPQARKSN